MAAIDRRIGLLFLAFVSLLAIAVLRAGYLGSIKAGWLQRAAQTQQVSTVPLPAERGEITDRNGAVLSLSETADDVIADPHLIKSPVQDAQKLSPVLGVPVLTLAAALSKPHTGYVVLARLIPAAKAHRAQKLVPNGITLAPDMKRVYPRAFTAAQVLGWTAGWNGQGTAGIESEFNRVLRGRDGVRRIVYAGGALAQPISIDDTRAARPGRTVRLTLDAQLQGQVEQVLAGVGAQYSPQSATAIVVNPNTGAIMALANWPQVNANDPYAGPSSTAVNNAIQDHATAFTYEPGSTFKAFTVAGALQDGLITPSTPFDIPPVLQVADRQIRDAEAHGYETLTTAGILEKSSNIGADLIGRRLGAARFNYWVHRFGFGAPTGVDLPAEDQGIILPLAKYSGSTMGNLPFGQGESVTPMQMIAAYSAIANGGILRAPHIVQSIAGRAAPLPPGTRILSPTAAAELRQMLIGVFGEGGTASGAAIPGYVMAGKTGTAQVAAGGKYSASAYVASFVGMVPANHPQLLAMVVVDQPQGSIFGGQVAAPAFQKIVGWAVPYLGISPR